MNDDHLMNIMGGSRGGQGVLLSNTGPDPLKNHKATKPAFDVGPSSLLAVWYTFVLEP